MKPATKKRRPRSTSIGRATVAAMEEALAFQRGEREARVVRQRIVIEPAPALTALAISRFRGTLGLSQETFAGALNVSVDTVRSWEQGRRTPDGAASRLLELAMKQPSLLAELVTYSRASDRRERRTR